jgi:Mn-dependent DtxR family transcriptional regulator
MATDQGRQANTHLPAADFDPAVLVTQKPSVLPEIYEYIITHGKTRPKAIQRNLDVSKSVTYSTLDKLQAVNLIEKTGYGVYEPADIALDPKSVYVLGELRSKKQYSICEFATEVNAFDAADLSEQLGGARSNVRAAAERLHEKQFLDRWWEPFAKSPKQYRVTSKGERALDSLDVETYLGWDGSEAVAFWDGIEGTEFHTPYEVEDVHYLANSTQEWVRPQEIASALEKNPKKTLKRLSKLEERGLITGDAIREKMMFKATRKSQSLFQSLRLFAISRTHNIEFYSLAKHDDKSGPWTPDELYSLFTERGTSPSIQRLNTALEDLKCAGLIDGNSRTGYSFTSE